MSLGYRHDLENHARLRDTARPFRLNKPFVAPKSISHRKWRTPKNQGNMGSCVGWGGSNGGEVLNYIDTRGGIVDISAMYMYLTSQQKAGLLGQDQGSFGSALLDAAKDTGFATEAKFPYPSSYTTRIPQEALAEGRLHLIRSHSVLNSYEEVFAWLASGTGVVLMCSKWVQSFAENNGVIERMAGQNYGGHCRVIHGYSERKDASGRNYLDEENSHGTQWGDGGFALYAPSVIDAICRDIRSGWSEVIGLSDLDAEFGEPRDMVDFTDAL